jgi:glycerol-3-phosphate dehydrogenase (NAD(P)+)
MAKKTAIIGAGSWGTALAIHSHNCGHAVKLWVHGAETLKILKQKRVNEIYLPDFPIPDQIELTSDASFLKDADCFVFAVPSHYFRETFQTILPHLPESKIIISAIKGMEQGTCLRISEIVKELSGNRFHYSVLSGPSFAVEVAQQNPTAVVIGSENAEIGKQIQADFSSTYFRLYYNDDVIGIEIGGSVKNVIAIAAGVVSGLGYGYNTLAGLITRGLAELNRFAVRLGAHPATLWGLAGLGDLVLTCTGGLSRNRYVGVELGRGRKIADITGGMRMVAEGVRTTETIYMLAKKLGVSMPITEQVYNVLYNDVDPRTAILQLMLRELKHE